jgi:ferredoxin-like protein FixX
LKSIGSVRAPAAAADQGPLDLGLDSDLFLAICARASRPEHIDIRDPRRNCRGCFPAPRAPCTRFCPADVYAAGEGETIRHPRGKTACSADAAPSSARSTTSTGKRRGTASDRIIACPERLLQ